jgi:hypothetical protein
VRGPSWQRLQKEQRGAWALCAALPYPPTPPSHTRLHAHPWRLLCRPRLTSLACRPRPCRRRQDVRRGAAAVRQQRGVRIPGPWHGCGAPQRGGQRGDRARLQPGGAGQEAQGQAQRGGGGCRAPRTATALGAGSFSQRCAAHAPTRRTRIAASPGPLRRLQGCVQRAPCAAPLPPLAPLAPLAPGIQPATPTHHAHRPRRRARGVRGGCVWPLPLLPLSASSSAGCRRWWATRRPPRPPPSASSPG